MEFLIGLAKALPPVLATLGTSVPVQEQANEELRVEWRVLRYQSEEGLASYTGGVKAFYGQTTVTSDDLELDYRKKTGVARGSVTVVDPDGTMTADSLEFNWVERTGTAHNVELKSNGARARVGRVQILKGQRWVLEDLWLTTSDQKTPDLSFSSSKTALTLGRSGRSHNAVIRLWGQRLPAIPILPFSLDPRVEGFRVPAISFRRGSGIGLAWRSGFLINDQTSISAQTSAFPKQFPTVETGLTWSAVSPTKASGFIEPRSDLVERFGDSAMENIVVRSPEREDEVYRSPRRSVSALSSWNMQTYGRRKDYTAVTKQWDLVGEIGDRFGSQQAYFGQVRLQSIRLDVDLPYYTRVLASGSLHSGPVRLAQNLDARLRVDGFASRGAGSRGYAWTRAAASISYLPVPQLRLAVSLSQGKDFGTPAFEIDPLFVHRSLNLRSDLLLGSINAGLLLRYDVNRKRWYDTEWAFSIAAGSFEPYLTARLYPREYRLGVRLRADALLSRLTRRTLTRSKVVLKPEETTSETPRNPLGR